MKKLGKKKLILYGCSGMGVNMLNIIVGTYLCSALLVGGFEANIEQYTYLSKDLVVAGLWGILSFIAKLIDGLIDLPASTFIDNMTSKWGKRKTAIVLGYIPTVVAYCLFLIPIDHSATILNTIWFAGILFIYYGAYTLTMLTYYATFSEVTEDSRELVLLSNTKSICDVVYFILGFALVPALIGMGMNVRIIALIFLPLSLTMLIPLFLLKEDSSAKAAQNTPRIRLTQSFSMSVKNKSYIYWMLTASIMNIGLQLFLTGINEFFSSVNITGGKTSIIMAASFAPVAFTIPLFNKITKSKGLGFSFRYILLVFSAGMSLMYICGFMSPSAKFIGAIICGLIVSFSIGAFFSVTYTVPSHLAALEYKRTGVPVASMYFAVQGLFEAVASGIAGSFILVFLKSNGLTSNITIISPLFCMIAFFMSFAFPKKITQIGMPEEQ